MKHFDTLQAYDDLIAKGASPIQARAQVNGMDGFLNQMASTFATEKKVMAFGSAIVIIGGFLVSLGWNLSVDMKDLARRMDKIESTMEELKDYVKK